MTVQRIELPFNAHCSRCGNVWHVPDEEKNPVCPLCNNGQAREWSSTQPVDLALGE